jgi:hypothetical protein
LRAHARGLYRAEAAVELLIGHRRWLDRDDFVDEFIEIGPGSICRAAMAFLDWVAVAAALDAGRLGCSDSEGQVLRIAASLAEGIPVDLGAALSGLDEANIVGVAQAVVHANGHRQAVVTLAGVVR